MLTLDEWKVFCKKQMENISRRTKCEIPTVDETTMEAQWKMNRFEGKKGITLNDFHLKAQYDVTLMAYNKKKKM